MITGLLNTWDSILAHLDKVRLSSSEQERIQLLIELLINLRLIGTDTAIPDMRVQKSDIEDTQREVESATRAMLSAVRYPSALFIYYAREVIKKFPVRQDAEEMIERIRTDAEAFEEDRTEDDPLKGFAGDLRKEVHRRLSPRIITKYLEPYVELAVRGNPDPIVASGYVALPYAFSAAAEDRHFIDLASDLLSRLRFLWDYEEGDMATVRRNLRNNLDIFERCFLRAEVEGLLSILNPEDLGSAAKELDAFKRLASVKFYLKESYLESRIDLYDLILLDLGLGRLIFLLANDLTNNHFAEVSPRNIRDALEVMRELLSISSIKGLAIQNVDLRQTELGELRESSVSDFIRLKRSLDAISTELQQYIQTEIIDTMSGTLIHVLENYSVPTARLSQLKTRYFNNFIRRTQIHVLSEFVEKVSSAVDRELERQRGERQLYFHYQRLEAANPDAESLAGHPHAQDLGEYIATTWQSPRQWLRPYLGGKGNSIIDMARLGLPVPPACILSHPLLELAERDDEREAVYRATANAIGELERQAGAKLGDPARPLLVSVRSGALTSMPGVMSTIMNVGLTLDVRAALRSRQGKHFEEALYARFLLNCASALGMEPRRTRNGAHRAGHGGTARLGKKRIDYLELALTTAFGPAFLTDAKAQLRACVRLVYDSRRSSAASLYSKTIASRETLRTAVTIQQVVFGNLNERSLSGVVLTRDPITGENALFGEFKMQAQGEEVVMGSADTLPIAELDRGVSAGLTECTRRLVEYFRQDLDLEFTVENGVLYLLQARAAKLGAYAQFIADTDFLKRGVIGLEKYRERVESLELAYANLSLPRADFRFRQWVPPLTSGISINGGVVSGTLAITPERLREAERRRESVVYFAINTKPTDFDIINLSSAIVTVYPGRTSHAAITAMSLNKPCIVGCSDLEIDYNRRRVIFSAAGGIALAEGERITVDGNAGAVYRGVAPISDTFLPVSALREAISAAKSPEQAVRAAEAMILEKTEALRRESSLKKLTLEALSGAEAEALRGANVLVRVDGNIELSEAPDRVESANGADRVAERRVALMLPVLRQLLDLGATPILCSHRGDPGTHSLPGLSRERIYAIYSLRPIAERLERASGQPIAFHEVSIGASGILISRKDIVPGQVNMIENLRYATGEKDNDEAFARSLANLSDGIFVNDAFNVCLRRHASIVGVPRFSRLSLAGPTVSRELEVLERVLGMRDRPFLAVFGGDEIESQYGAISAMATRVDTLAIILPNSAPKPSDGVETSAEKAIGREARAALIGSLRRTAPANVIVIDRADPQREAQEYALATAIGAARAILWAVPTGIEPAASPVPDTPSNTPAAAPYRGALREAIRGALRDAPLVIICSETEKYMAARSARNLHISTGPRAFLQYLERLSLPGITALSAR